MEAGILQMGRKNDRLITISGEETRGAEIKINDEYIKLPDDVFIKAYVVHDDYLEQKIDYNIHLPFYTIQRGDSVIMISVNTGYVVNRHLAPGQENAFDFLRFAVKGVLPEVEGIE